MQEAAQVVLEQRVADAVAQVLSGSRGLWVEGIGKVEQPSDDEQAAQGGEQRGD
jgi:hypothetical protein